jgi:hypothetical protein
MPRCADCGIEDDWTADFIEVDGRIICRHRYACEARQMLTRGEPIEKVAEHAQKARPW